jgi:electron-transferring-flavoprotein dehydrogenase
MVQIWPGMPAAEPLLEGGAVTGVRLADQGTDLQGHPEAGFTPGMDLHAALTVVADGPVGAVGRKIDERIGMPQGHESGEWALGMKMVVELRGDKDSGLEPGTVLHTIGFPEPEIFGFLYVHPERLASVGIFIPSWFRSPVRTGYRYLQHFMLHPYFVASPRRRNTEVVGCKVAAGIGPPRRAVSGWQWLCAHRRRIGKHKRARGGRSR